jgi:nicotinamide-nucleotide amidase
MMKAEIISIGTELLLGEVANTNSLFLANQMPLLGIELGLISTVGDDKETVIKAISGAWRNSDMIITTGGLGPTRDDITRESIAQFLGEELVIDKIALHKMEALFKKRNFEMTSNNIKQASKIPSAKIIDNLRGTAPGWWVEKGGHIIIAIPGPPLEMQYMWYGEILPRLKEKTGTDFIALRTLKTYGLGESKVDELLSGLPENKVVSIGTYAKQDGIHIQMSARSETKDEALRIVNSQENSIKTLLKDHIWGTDSETIESIVVNFLSSNGLTFATMESETAGLLADRILSVETSANCYQGGIVAYDNRAKILFGVRAEVIDTYGSISQEAAGEMAKAARKKLKVDIGIGVTGVMEATTLTNKPPGTVYIGIDNGSSVQTFQQFYPTSFIRVKERALNAVFFRIRQAIIQKSEATRK